MRGRCTSHLQFGTSKRCRLSREMAPTADIDLSRNFSLRPVGCSIRPGRCGAGGAEGRGLWGRRERRGREGPVEEGARSGDGVWGREREREREREVLCRGVENVVWSRGHCWKETRVPRGGCRWEEEEVTGAREGASG